MTMWFDICVMIVGLMTSRSYNHVYISYMIVRDFAGLPGWSGFAFPFLSKDSQEGIAVFAFA